MQDIQAHIQPGILAEETRLARYMTFSLLSLDGSDQIKQLKSTLRALAAVLDHESVVVGLGQSLVRLLVGEVPGLKTYPAQTGAGLEIPSTPAALWCWLRGSDRGELFHRSRRIESLLASSFELIDIIDAFQYSDNRDLTGYEDGTENPSGDAAIDAAIVKGQGAGLDGGSFVAVMQWLHDFDAFHDLSQKQQDDIIGRHIADNKEYGSAPASAHVKRSAQESFEPDAFILRRSMPWADDLEGGLVFVAFGRSFDAFEAIFQRMLGNEDNIIDAMFTISRPISGAYFWCPPLKGGKLDLSVLGIA